MAYGYGSFLSEKFVNLGLPTLNIVFGCLIIYRYYEI